MENQIIKHLTDNDAYTFSVCYLYLKKFPRASGQYTFFDRNDTVYPPGFAELVREQVRAMESIVVSEDEIAFMSRRCYYFPTWFYTFLKGYRFDASEVGISQDQSGRLSISVEGLLWKTVFWEVPILAIISELKHRGDGDLKDYQAGREYEKSLAKGSHLIKDGLSFAEFGTRRRFTFDHHDLILQALVEAHGRRAVPRMGQCAAEGCYGQSCSSGNRLLSPLTEGQGSFSGSSNVYFCMKYDLVPIGTMSHQVVSFCGAIFGYKEANFIAMSYWQETFESDLGTFLYDTYGWDAFQKNFSKIYAKLFDGLRVDSGDNFRAVDKIVAKYRELGIDPLTKSLTFSNGLSVAEAVEIHRYCQGRIRDNYGIGTFLTCDVTNVRPMNIVMKLTSARLTEKKSWQKAIKLSDDPGKHTGDPDEVDLAQRTLGLK